MLYLILLGVTFFIQLLAASWYCLAKSNKLEKVFRYKMLCSGIYIADILLCGAIGNCYGNIFYYIILSGILLTFTGDIFEDKLKKGSVLFPLLRGLSSLCFFAGLIYFGSDNFGANLFTKPVSIAAAVFSVLAVALLLIRDKALRKLNLFPFLSTALFFAVALICGIEAQSTGIAAMQTLSCIFIMSSSALLISDYLHFGKNKNSKALLRTNLYYFGLMVFSCSVACL